MALTWYDAFGREVDTSALKEEQAAPTSGAVRRHTPMHPAAGLTPVALAQILRSSIDADPERYLALAEDIEERDAHYLSVLSTRKGQVAGLDVTVDAAGDDQGSVEQADLIREFVGRDTFEIEVKDILDATGKGFSCTEIVWETSEKQWMPKRLAWREPRAFRFDQADGETPLYRGPLGDEPLKPFGWIFHTFKAKSGLPIRGGLARAAAWPFLFKRFTDKDWAIFCEAYGQPLRLGKYGAGASEKDKEILLEAVQNIGADYAAIVPTSMAIEFVKADIAGSHELYEKRADWLDRQVSKLVIGQTSTTDAQKGSYAVGRVHDEVRQDIERADAKALAATINRDLVRPLIDLNFGPQKSYPIVRIGRPEQVDGIRFMAAVEKFVKVGGKVGMSTVRDKLGLPDPDKDEELLAPASRAAPEPGAEDGEKTTKRGRSPIAGDAMDAAEAMDAGAIEASHQQTAQMATGRLPDELIGEAALGMAGPAIGQLVERVRGIVAQAGNLEAAERALANALLRRERDGEAVPDADLVAAMRQAMLLAWLSGEASNADS